MSSQQIEMDGNQKVRIPVPSQPSRAEAAGKSPCTQTSPSLSEQTQPPAFVLGRVHSLRVAILKTSVLGPQGC